MVLEQLEPLLGSGDGRNAASGGCRSSDLIFPPGAVMSNLEPREFSDCHLSLHFFLIFFFFFAEINGSDIDSWEDNYS